MKTTGNYSQNQPLENLFREIRQEAPSPDFTKKMTFRIEQEIRKKKRKRKQITIAQIATGVFGIIAVAAGMLYRENGFAFSFPKIAIPFDPLVWTIGLAVLFVLIGDSLLRKHTYS
ncbi:MAG: hypothetical protein LBH19_04725 [Dysgonamonadaceae bacterium]|jgi:hypothetical protein|nr:hypothetical protein [Dysgonamonadaceae bacterium]